VPYMGLAASAGSYTIGFISKLQQYSLPPEGHIWVTLFNFFTHLTQNCGQILDFNKNMGIKKESRQNARGSLIFYIFLY
jgi:hypothetical protein